MYRAVLKSQPDRTLAVLAAEGSEPAFEVIVLRYRRALLGYCRRLRLSENRSEDVVQQAFINAWGSLRGGTEVQELRPWLYRITHNQAVSALRARGSDDASLSDLLCDSGGCRGAEAGEAAASVEEIYERQWRLRETLGAVARLPELQREALLATAVDGLSYDQVATVLNTSGDAVRGLVYRARNSLRTGIAVISPSPLVVWAAGHAGQPVSATVISQWMTEAAAAGGGSVGLGAAAIKGAALVASSAVVVTGTVGSGLDRQVFGSAHHAPATGRTTSSASAHSARSTGHAALAAVPASRTGIAAPVHGAASRSTSDPGSGRSAAGLAPSGGGRGGSGTATTGSGSGSASSGRPSGSARSGGAPSGNGMATGGGSAGGSAMDVSEPQGAPPEEMRMRPSGQPSISGLSGQGDGAGQNAGAGSSGPSASGSGSGSGSGSASASSGGTSSPSSGTSTTSSGSSTSTTSTTPMPTTTGGETTTTATTTTPTTTSTTAASS